MITIGKIIWKFEISDKAIEWGFVLDTLVPLQTGPHSDHAEWPVVQKQLFDR